MRWLRRYLDEKEPTLKEFARVVRELETGGQTDTEGLPCEHSAESLNRSSFSLTIASWYGSSRSSA
jgi:hypothetical protein